MLRLQSGLLAAVCLMLTGCWIFDEPATDTTDGSGTAIEHPEGDPNVSAEDGGPGFPAAVEPGTGAATGSTGLGLDIARRTTEAAGGTIRLGRSALGGALIELCFPRHP